MENICSGCSMVFAAKLKYFIGSSRAKSVRAYGTRRGRDKVVEMDWGLGILAWGGCNEPLGLLLTSYFATVTGV